MNGELKAELAERLGTDDPVAFTRIDGLLAQTPEDFAQADAQGDLLLVAWNDERLSGGSDVAARQPRKIVDLVENGVDLEKREEIPGHDGANPDVEPVG